MTDLFTDIQKPKERDLPDPMSVSEVSKRINSVLEGRIGRVTIVGQINSPKLGHHWYFTLADQEAKIDCAMWASRVAANQVESSGHQEVGVWKPKQGDQVIVTGTVGHYAKFGKTQIYVERMVPVGKEKGKLQQQFDALIKECKEAGWFEASAKKPLPQYPRNIAVITSASSAAVRDVIETARQRWKAVDLLIVHVPVQGIAAAPAIIDALQRVDRVAKRWNIDAIIVTRGGGSLEELWSFNDRGVVEAAFRCNTPIVAAIGHESDTSIIELVADHRASTPTQAAMVLIPDAEELQQMVHHYKQRLTGMMQRGVEQREGRVLQSANALNLGVVTRIHTRNGRISALSEALAKRRPHALLQARQKRLMAIVSDVRVGGERTMAAKQHRVETLASRLEAIGPLAVLRRGFTLTEDAQGNIIRSTKAVKDGQQIRTILANGTIESKVECST